MRASNRDRFSGCLIGQCLGDALGFPAEGFPHEDCARFVRNWLSEPGPGDEKRGPPPNDQYADDSQLARELIQSYVARGRIDPRDYAERIAAISVEGRIVRSVLWSLYSFLWSPDDYMETIRSSIAVGGDVDTTAAMAGAVSGAHLGIHEVHEELRRRVTDQGTWEYEELVDLAHRCYAVKTEGAD